MGPRAPEAPQPVALAYNATWFYLYNGKGWQASSYASESNEVSSTPVSGFCRVVL